MDDGRLTEAQPRGPRRRRYLIRSVPREVGPPSNTTFANPPDDRDALAHRLFARSRHDMIAEAAYYRAAQRGFVGGDSDRDWYEAEAEIEALLCRSRPV
jgi:hypothetical protein